MKSLGAAVVVLGLAAGGAWAQYAKPADPAYDSQLRARALAPADKDYCAKQAASDQAACQVTRNYLADISKKCEKGFPPSADIRFTKNVNEQNALMDRAGG